MNLLNSYTALRTGCTPGKTLNCLAHSMHVSALRSRRSLRSLARCARLVMLNVLNNLERIVKHFWNIEKTKNMYNAVLEPCATILHRFEMS